MARYVMTTATKVTGSGYNVPDRNLRKGDVLELTAAEGPAIGAGNLRALAVPPVQFGTGCAPRIWHPRSARHRVRGEQRDTVGGRHGDHEYLDVQRADDDEHWVYRAGAGGWRRTQ